MLNIFEHRRIRQVFTILMLAGSLACMFPPQHPFFQWWASQTVAIVATYVGVGLVFLMYNNFRLMFVCFGCSAAICFFKNETESAHKGPSYFPTPPESGNLLFQSQHQSPDVFRDLVKYESDKTPK